MSATGLLVYLCGFFAGAYLVFQGARMMGNPEKLWSALNNFGTLTPAKTMRTAAFFPTRPHCCWALTGQQHRNLVLGNPLHCHPIGIHPNHHQNPRG